MEGLDFPFANKLARIDRTKKCCLPLVGCWLPARYPNPCTQEKGSRKEILTVWSERFWRVDEMLNLWCSLWRPKRPFWASLQIFSQLLQLGLRIVGKVSPCALRTFDSLSSWYYHNPNRWFYCNFSGHIPLLHLSLEQNLKLASNYKLCLCCLDAHHLSTATILWFSWAREKSWMNFYKQIC